MRTKTFLLAACAIHSVLLLVFTYFSLKSPFTSDEELMLLQFTSGLKRKVFQKNEKPGSDRFLFISISWDKKLIDKLDEYGTPIGKQPITDRAIITRFLEILNQKPGNHEFLMVDIFFADSLGDGSKDDQALAEQLQRTPNVLIPYHLTSDNTPDYPIFKASLGLADYEPTVDGQLVKFNIVRDGKYKTMPLLMYEQITGNTYKAGSILDRVGDKPVMNAFILDHRIFEEDLSGNPPVYKKYYLGELLSLPPEVIHEFTKDKIIVLGDLDSGQDVHRTIHGNMLGSVILLNTFLALENSDNQITWVFILFLLTGYAIISYICFRQINILEGWLLKWLPLPNYVKELIESFASYLLYFTLLSVLSYLLFNFQLTILLISFYMQVLEWVMKNFIRNLACVQTPKEIA
jgi:hypothetical protein